MMGMLNVQVLHRKPQPINNVKTGNCNRKKICKNLVNNHYILLNRNAVLHNFKYNVKFKENFYPPQQKERIFSEHLQNKFKAEVDKLMSNRHVVREKEMGEDNLSAH